MGKGIGIDIENVKRFRDNLENKRFLEKIFSEREIVYCENKKDPAESYAGKFCAKESVLKSLEKNVPLKEIEIINGFDGKISVYIAGKIRPDIKCSISHTSEVSVAFSYIGPNVKPQSSVKISIELDKISAGIEKLSKEISVSLGDVVSYAICKAMKEFPEFNSKFLNDMEIYSEFNMGQIINLGKGPKKVVIKNCDSKNLKEISKEIKQKALDYIHGELEDDSDETFLVTNLSSFCANDSTSALYENTSALFSIMSKFDSVKIFEGSVLGCEKFNIVLNFDSRISDCQRASKLLEKIKSFLEDGNYL